MISDQVKGNSVDAWTTVKTIRKPLSFTGGIKNNGGANDLSWRLRGRVIASGPAEVINAATVVTPGNTNLKNFDTVLWELEIQVKSTVAGNPTPFTAQYAAAVEL